MTAEARQWINDLLAPESWQWQGCSLAIEPRYFPAIHEAITDEGFTVAAA